MDRTPRAARIGAIAFALWGVVHLAGGALQLATLRSGGAGALTAMIATANPAPAGGFQVATPAGAFMGMGAFTIMWIGLLVTAIAVRYNWRNSRRGYVLNMALVGATDFGLVLFLLAPGQMAWGDGSIGLGLFAIAAVGATIGVRSARARG